MAIGRFHAHLAGAVDAEGKPNTVLRAFALHLQEHLLAPSGRGCGRAGTWVASVPAGCFTYEPPRGVVWEVQSLGLSGRWPAAVERLASFLSVWLALVLLATGCAGPRPLKGGKAVTTHKPAIGIEQTLVQGENPSQASKQTQESVKVRIYTVPAGSRVEQSPMWEGERPREPKLLRSTAEIRTFEGSRPPGRQQLSTLDSQPPVHHSFSGGGSTTFVICAPMPVVEREETRAGTELGAAQKDTARELGARLSSLKGIVWVGVGLFVFGLAALVWPPLKVVIGSVTTSAALVLGGLALMVLPSLIVGNELLILGGVVVAVSGWFLAHRHGQLRGIIAATAGTPGAGSADHKS